MNLFSTIILSFSLSFLSFSAPVLAQQNSGQPLNTVPFQGPQGFKPDTNPDLLYQDSSLRLELYYPSRQAQTKARLLQAYNSTETRQRNAFFSLRFHPASCDVFMLKSTLKGAGKYVLKTLKQKHMTSKIPQGVHIFYFLSLCNPSPAPQHTVAFELITPQKSLILQKKSESFPCKPTQKVSAEIQQHLDRFEAPVDVLSTDMALMIEEAAEYFPHLQFFKYISPYDSSVYLQDQEINASVASYINHDEVWKEAKVLRKPFNQLPRGTRPAVLQCVTDFQHEQLLERVEVLRQKSEWLHHLPQSPSIEGLSALDNLLRHFFFRINTSQGVNDYYAVAQKSNS